MVEYHRNRKVGKCKLRFLSKRFQMNDCYVLFAFSWCSLFLTGFSTKLSKPNFSDEKFTKIKNNMKNISKQEKLPFHSYKLPLKFDNGSMRTNIYNKQEDLKYKLASLLPNEQFPVKELVDNNNSCYAFKPLSSDLKNSSNLTLCCCSKDMQQKCEGVDLSYLLPIPGDNSTITKSSSVPYGNTSSTCQTKLLTVAPSMGSDYNANRSCRRAEESALDALKRLQLTHGIFAPNEQEMEKAIEKARFDMPKEKSRVWLNKMKNDIFVKLQMPRPSRRNDGEYKINSNDLSNYIPYFKNDKTLGEGKPSVTIDSVNKDLSLLTQNANTIKKQLETIRQYDILLANIRAQTQLKLIELADIETKHHLEEVIFKKERDQSLQKLKDAEEMLKQEVKLAHRLPDMTVNNWQDVQDPKILGFLLNDRDVGSQNMDNRIPNSNGIQETAKHNNRLLEDLENALHQTDKYKDSNVELKPDYRNFEGDSILKKMYLLHNAISRETRAPNESHAIANCEKRTKRKSIDSDNSSNTTVEFKDKVLQNLQTDFQEPKVVSRMKKHSSDTNPANYTSNTNSKIQVIHSNSNNISNLQKNKITSKNTS